MHRNTKKGEVIQTFDIKFIFVKVLWWDKLRPLGHFPWIEL